MPFTLPLPIILLVAVFVLATSGALYAVLAERQRRAVLRRATSGTSAMGALLRPHASRNVFASFVNWLAARTPVQMGNSTAVTSKLVQAGFDGAAAPGLFGLIRIASAVTVPLLSLAVVPKDNVVVYVSFVALAVFIGLLAPQAVLDRICAGRQEVIRKGIPDSLDLLVVCVEAGIALDAALQRVARELSAVHPMLAEELSGMSRRVAAGMAREQALHGLYLRTGVDELRGLASHMLQSEKWGTSIATVLRVYGDQLRKKRKMKAEKRAATASTRMLLPLALFIFPTIFVVLLGPAAMQISGMFDSMGQ